MATTVFVCSSSLCFRESARTKGGSSVHGTSEKQASCSSLRFRNECSARSAEDCRVNALLFVPLPWKDNNAYESGPIL